MHLLDWLTIETWLSSDCTCLNQMQKSAASSAQGLLMPKPCKHENVEDEVCRDCGKKVGTCQHCDGVYELNAAGYISYHSWPPPTRQVCRGSTYSSKEDLAREEK